jgi:DNA-binding response OmpR family regulator
MDSNAVILIVDDNEMNRDVLVRRLERQGYVVRSSEDGEQALRLLRQEPIDLVLLDIMMPGLSGHDVLATMKSDSDLRSIPVIMISAVDEIDSVAKCIELGAEDYLFKPFNPILLNARIRSSLARRVESMNAAHSAVPSSALLLIDVIESKLEFLLTGQIGSLTDEQAEFISDIQTFIGELKYQL